jgi:hypothetical protein
MATIPHTARCTSPCNLRPVRSLIAGVMSSPHHPRVSMFPLDDRRRLSARGKIKLLSVHFTYQTLDDPYSCSNTSPSVHQLHHSNFLI